MVENEEPNTFCLTLMSIPSLELLSEIRELYGNDQAAQLLLSQIASEQANGNYSLKDGCLYYKNSLYIPKDQSLKLKILHLVHNNTSGGHSGSDKTFHRASCEFYWLGLRREVKKFDVIHIQKVNLTILC